MTRRPPNYSTTRPIDYLAIGHVAKDLTPDGHRLGGSVAYASLTARAMGYTPGILTACALDVDLSPLDGLALQRCASPASTTFENLYTANGRLQYLRTRAVPLAPGDVPLEWLRAPIVHIAPLAREIEPEMLTGFGSAFVGLTLQGWLRQWDEAGRVSYADWPDAAETLPNATAAVLSIEDVRGDWELLKRWASLIPVLVVTQAAEGCTVFVRGQDARHIATFRQTEIDPTGAGDIFAAAFFIHYYETRDPWAAARVANHIASISVTRSGLASAPTPDDVGLARLKAEGI